MSAPPVIAAGSLRRFNFFRALVLSFFSRELYADVAWRWRGTGLTYLFLLLVLAVLPHYVRFQIEAVQFSRQQGPAIIRQMPVLTLKDGRVSTEPPGRHEITDPETGKVVMVIDTQAGTTLDPETDILINETHLIARRTGRGEVRAYELGRFGDHIIDQNRLQRWLNIGKYIVPACVLVFLLIFVYVYRIIQTLFYSLFALLFMNIRKVALDYLALMRLIVVAITPAVLIDVVDDFIPGEIPLLWLICFVISMSYLWFGINAAAIGDPSRNTPAATPAPVAS